MSTRPVVTVYQNGSGSYALSLHQCWVPGAFKTLKAALFAADRCLDSYSWETRMVSLWRSRPTPRVPFELHELRTLDQDQEGAEVD